jgi:2-phospho-L-lactate/phosphoenolpyruvate guanylyltransferase
MRTAAILPVKHFSRAKQRLGASVPDRLRFELARAMVADVLLALAQTPSVERTIIVTREQSVAVPAREQGAIVLDDVTESGQSAAAALGVRWAMAEGIERVLCVPGDCPALDPEELEALLRSDADGTIDAHRATGPDEQAEADGHGGERAVVIVPDRHGTGTNGLLLSPPDAIAPSFGPDSAQRHRALALAAGVPVRVRQTPSLLLDIDTGADLAALRERLAGLDSRAPRTRAVLGQPEHRNVSPLTSGV